MERCKREGWVFDASDAVFSRLSQQPEYSGINLSGRFFCSCCAEKEDPILGPKHSGHNVCGWAPGSNRTTVKKHYKDKHAICIPDAHPERPKKRKRADAASHDQTTQSSPAQHQTASASTAAEDVEQAQPEVSRTPFSAPSLNASLTTTTTAGVPTYPLISPSEQPSNPAVFASTVGNFGLPQSVALPSVSSPNVCLPPSVTTQQGSSTERQYMVQPLSSTLFPPSLTTNTLGNLITSRQATFRQVPSAELHNSGSLAIDVTASARAFNVHNNSASTAAFHTAHAPSSTAPSSSTTATGIAQSLEHQNLNMGTSIGLLPQNLGISEPPLLSSLCDSGSKSSSQYPLVNVQSFGHSSTFEHQHLQQAQQEQMAAFTSTSSVPTPIRTSNGYNTDPHVDMYHQTIDSSLRCPSSQPLSSTMTPVVPVDQGCQSATACPSHFASLAALGHEIQVDFTLPSQRTSPPPSSESSVNTENSQPASPEQSSSFPHSSTVSSADDNHHPQSPDLQTYLVSTFSLFAQNLIRNGIEDFVAGYDRTKPMNTKPVMDPTRSSSTTCQLCGHNISEDQQMYTLDQRTRICSGCKKKECFANPLAFECKSCGIYTLIPHNEGKETVWACNTHLCLAFREFTRFVPATEIASEIQKMIRRVLQWAAEPATNMDGYRDNAIQSKIRDILDRLMLRSAFASLAFHPAICLGCHVLQLVSADAGVDPGDIPCNNCDNTLTLKLLTLDPMTPMQIFLPSEHTPPIRSGYGSDVGSSRRQVSDANTPYSFGVPLRPSEERQCDGRFDERYLALFNSLEQLFLPPELHNPTTLRKSVLFTATKEGTSKTILHSIKDPKARSDSGPTVADFERLKAINRMVFEILRGIDLELNTDRALLNEPEDLKRRLIRGFYLRNGFIKEWKDQINSYIDRRHKIVPENQLVLPDQARAFFPLQIYPYRPCGMSFVLNIEYLKKLEEVTLVFKSDILSGQAEVVPFVKARLIDGGTTLQWTFTQPSGEEEIQTTKLEGAEMFRYHVSISFDKGSRHVEVEGMPRLHFVHKGDPLILRFRLWSGFDKAQVDSELYLSDKKALYLADVKRDREQVTNSDLSKVLGEHDLGACKH